MADFLAVAATIAGIVMAASPSLQIRRMLANRSSADVSTGYLIVLLAGFSVWIAYGVAIGNAALIISNAASFAFGMATLLIAFRLRRRV